MDSEELKSIIWSAASAGDVQRVILLLKKLCAIRISEGCFCKARQIAEKVDHLTIMYRDKISPWN